jgi:hypothetical protein
MGVMGEFVVVSLGPVHTVHTRYVKGEWSHTARPMQAAGDGCGGIT